MSESVDGHAFEAARARTIDALLRGMRAWSSSRKADVGVEAARSPKRDEFGTCEAASLALSVDPAPFGRLGRIRPCEPAAHTPFATLRLVDHHDA